MENIIAPRRDGLQFRLFFHAFTQNGHFTMQSACHGLFRHFIFSIAAISCLTWCVAQAPSDQAPSDLAPSDLDPKLQVAQSGVRLTLVAEHPRIVTPTGIDVDDSGRIWAVASHTHFRPKDYQGPEHDEIVVLTADDSGPGRARTVFYNQTDATMDLELGRDFASDGWVYLAERDRILRVRDTDGDGRGDEEQDLAVLETEADYPHNGLSGLAWHPNGDLIFALGENYWKPWTLTATDGSVVTGTGEGGVFRCHADGTSLRRIARGFWNPFGICVREDATMFAAENDPGARPPCRLLHVVDGGDYGYQRRYGNAPFHPFVCWNGELSGTLPMLHGLGEAPCGIAALGNGLLVPSWTDHRIDFYPLVAKGASFATERVTLVHGGDHFRPTCITQDSPTVFYLTDWVFGSYELHGRGRVWKLEIDAAAAPWLGEMKLNPATQDATTATLLRAGGQSYSDPQLFQLARSVDPFIRLAAIDALSQRADTITETMVNQLSTQDRISVMLAIRKSGLPSSSWVRYFLGQADGEIRFQTLRWISDAQLKSFLPDVEGLLRDPDIEYPIYEACLAAWNSLSGNPDLGIADPQMLISRVTNPGSSARTRAFALRLLDPNEMRFAPQLWQELFDSNDPLLVSELTRALVGKGTGEAKEFLWRIAEDEAVDLVTRGDALSGLAGSSGQTQQKLIALAGSTERTLREEALRSLRFTELDEAQRETLTQVEASFPDSADLVRSAINPESLKQTRPDLNDISSWQRRLAKIEQPIDLDAGRRIFHHASVGTCVKCHRHTGRGSAVGPDLSAASNVGDPGRLLRALLQPSREVDPQYFPRMLVTADGHVFTGIMLRDGGGGKEFYRDNAGRERMFLTAEIVERKELNTSMMPDGLVDLMTDRELRDLLAFLDTSFQNPKDGDGALSVNRFVNPLFFDFFSVSSSPVSVSSVVWSSVAPR